MKPAVTPELLAAVCHDLRGPLGAIGTWLHVLASGQAEPETRAQALAAMARDVRAQGALLEQLGELASLMAGDLSARPGPVELGPLLASVISAETHVRLESGPGGARVQADPALLARLLSLLVTAAVKRPADAPVSVRVDGAVVEIAAEGPPRLLGVALARGLAELQGGSLEETVSETRTSLRLRLPPA